MATPKNNIQRGNDVIYFFRHGETFWNLEGRYQGQLNSDLTPRGIEQIELAAAEFSKNEVLDGPIKVYVSPLGRAQQTARILAEHIDCELLTDHRLREVSVGSWDGKTGEEIRRENPHITLPDNPYFWHFRSPDGETLAQAKERARSFLEDMEGKRICVVAHGMIGRVLMGVYTHTPDQDLSKIFIAQDAYYKLENGQIEMVGHGKLHADQP